VAEYTFLLIKYSIFNHLLLWFLYWSCIWVGIIYFVLP